MKLLLLPKDAEQEATQGESGEPKQETNLFLGLGLNETSAIRASRVLCIRIRELSQLISATASELI